MSPAEIAVADRPKLTYSDLPAARFYLRPSDWAQHVAVWPLGDSGPHDGAFVQVTAMKPARSPVVETHRPLDAVTAGAGTTTTVAGKPNARQPY